jgi:hydrogenase maturation protease
MNEWEFDLLERKTPVDRVESGGIVIERGDRVRLRPRPGGDVMDIALAGQAAIVDGIEQDYDGKVHLAVVLDDDPGRDLGLARQPGHRFFFDPGDVELLERRDVAPARATPPAHVLIACIGNIFFGDDGFGVEVARRLSQREWPAGIRVVDFGIRGFDLACALEGPDLTILVDAYPHNAAPGTVTVIEPDLTSMTAPAGEEPGLEPHGLDPVSVLRLAAALRIAPRRLLLVGCQPLTLGGDDGAMGLSAPVEAAVDLAIAQIERLVDHVTQQPSDAH